MIPDNGRLSGCPRVAGGSGALVCVVAVCSLLLLSYPAGAQSAPENPIDIGDVMHYVVQRDARLYPQPLRQRPSETLDFREPVFVLSSRNGWSHIHTQKGGDGYVATDAISNVWIRVSKLRKRLYLYMGTRLVMEVPADFGFNAIADKERRGSESDRNHWRTPEGAFYVVKKNQHSQFYKAFLLNYPNAEDAERGLLEGLISKREHDRIMAADASSMAPPMNTLLGGMIEIHGEGTGLSTNWTEGCVAVTNEQMDQLWGWVNEGTPVIIEK